MNRREELLELIAVAKRQRKQAYKLNLKNLVINVNNQISRLENELETL